MAWWKGQSTLPGLLDGKGDFSEQVMIGDCVGPAYCEAGSGRIRLPPLSRAGGMG